MTMCFHGQNKHQQEGITTSKWLKITSLKPLSHRSHENFPNCIPGAGVEIPLREGNKQVSKIVFSNYQFIWLATVCEYVHMKREVDIGMSKSSAKCSSMPM